MSNGKSVQLVNKVFEQNSPSPYTKDILELFPNVTVCDERGFSMPVNKALLSATSGVLKKILKASEDADRIVLSGYSSDFIRAFKQILFSGIFRVNNSIRARELQCDFKSLGISVDHLEQDQSVKHEIESDKSSSSMESNEVMDNDRTSDGQMEKIGDRNVSVDSVGGGLTENQVQLKHYAAESDELLGPFDPFAIIHDDATGQTRYRCPLCLDMDFKWIQGLKRHVVRVHPDEAGYLDVTHVCSQCSKSLDGLNQLLHHIRNSPCCQGKQENGLSVRTFENNFELKPTSTQTHPEAGMKEYDVSVIIQKDKENPWKFWSYCPLCKDRYPNFKALQKHTRKCHPQFLRKLMKNYSCQGCSKTFKNLYYYEKHTQGNQCSVESFCQFCGKTFSNQATLKLHIREMHNNVTITCEKCDRTFKSKKVYNRHLVLHHSTPVPCEVCGRMFKNSTNLRCHILTVHTDNEAKPYKCSVCSKAYGRSGQLLIHERTHRNEKPFQCHYCEYATGNAANRIIHEKNVHKELYSEEKKRKMLQISTRNSSPS